MRDDTPIADGTTADRGDDHHISAPQLGTMIDVSPITLAQWRTRGEGPPFVRLGRTIRYRMGDVRAWLRSRTVGHTVATRGGGR